MNIDPEALLAEVKAENGRLHEALAATAGCDSNCTCVIFSRHEAFEAFCEERTKREAYERLMRNWLTAMIQQSLAEQDLKAFDGYAHKVARSGEMTKARSKLLGVLNACRPAAQAALQELTVAAAKLIPKPPDQKPG